VDPGPDPLLRKSGSAGYRTRTSGSVARNSNNYTTEAVRYILLKRAKLTLLLIRHHAVKMHRGVEV
jgi:hypothetical protein